MSAGPHSIRISLDSEGNCLDEIGTVDCLSKLLGVAQEDIVILMVERSINNTRKLTLVFALQEAQNAAQWASMLNAGDTLHPAGKIRQVHVNLEGQSPSRRRARSTTSPGALAELQSQAQGRIIQELKGESSLKTLAKVLGMMSPGVSAWGCLFRWRLNYRSSDPAALDRSTVDTLATEGEFILTAMNNHIYGKQQELLLSPKSQKKVLKQEMKQLDARCERLRDAFSSVNGAKKQQDSSKVEISVLTSQLSTLLQGQSPEAITEVLQQLRSDTISAAPNDEHKLATAEMEELAAAEEKVQEDEAAAEAAKVAVDVAEVEKNAAEEALAKEEAEAELAAAEKKVQEDEAAAEAAKLAADAAEAEKKAAEEALAKEEAEAEQAQKEADEAAQKAKEAEESGEDPMAVMLLTKAAEAAAAAAAKEKAEAEAAAAKLAEATEGAGAAADDSDKFKAFLFAATME